MPTVSAARSRSSSVARVKHRLFEIVVLAAALVLLIATSSRRPRSQSSFRTDVGDVQLSASGDVRLSTLGTLFEIIGRGDPEDVGDVRAVRDAWGIALDGVAIGAFVDGAPRDLRIDSLRTTPQGPAHAMAHAEIDMGQ